MWLGAQLMCAPTQRAGYAKDVPNWMRMRVIASVLSLHHIWGEK
jgi:hypothetical protein